MSTLSTIRRILVLTDFSATSDRAVDWAAALARSHGAELWTVHGLQRTLPAAKPKAESVPQHAARRLNQLAQNLPDDVRASTEIRAFQGRAMVSELRQDEQPDLIVIGSNGHGAVRRFFLGSTATAVVRESPRPVVTVHPDDLGHPRGIRSVLVPTDLTEGPERAADAASALVARDDEPARIVLLHVHRMAAPVAAAAGGSLAVGPAPPVPFLQPEMRERARADLDQAASRLRAAGHPVQEVFIDEVPGSVASITCQVAGERGVDLVAMGTHNRTGLERVLTGSTAETVLSSAPCPVFTIPLGTTEDSR